MSFLSALNSKYEIVSAKTAVYHVTLASKLAAIASQGLTIGNAPHIGGEMYREHRKGKLFLTGKGGIAFWVDRAEEWVRDGHEPEDFLPKLLIPVVLKVSLDSTLLEKDSYGISDSKQSAFFTTKAVPVSALSIFYEDKWLPISSWKKIDFKSALEFGDEDWNVDFLDVWSNPLFPSGA